MILDFNNFINEEHSKNDPIPEINRHSKHLGIILMGAPGVGKSTFIKNFIQTKNINAKSFSTDDVAELMRKTDKGRDGFNKMPSDINLLRLRKYIETGRTFVYDTTGLHVETVTDIAKLAKSNGYEIIIIHMVSDLMAIKHGNKNRERVADDSYVETVYQKQFHNMIEYINRLNPKNYYMVFNHKPVKILRYLDKYKFYKFENGHLLKRKVDRYVPIKKPITSLRDLSLHNMSENYFNSRK